MNLYHIEVEIESDDFEEIAFAVRAANQDDAERKAWAATEARGETPAGMTVYGIIETVSPSMTAI